MITIHEDFLFKRGYQIELELLSYHYDGEEQGNG